MIPGLVKIFQSIKWEGTVYRSIGHSIPVNVSAFVYEVRKNSYSKFIAVEVTAELTDNLDTR